MRRTMVGIGLTLPLWAMPTASLADNSFYITPFADSLSHHIISPPAFGLDYESDTSGMTSDANAEFLAPQSEEADNDGLHISSEDGSLKISPLSVPMAQSPAEIVALDLAKQDDGEGYVAVFVESETESIEHVESSDGTMVSVYGLDEVRAGGAPPRDVVMVDRKASGKTPTVWAKSGVSYFDESLTVQTIQGTFATLDVGGTYPLSDQLTAVFDLSYTHGAMDGNNAVNQTMDMDGISGSVALDYAITQFDSVMAGFGFGREWTHNAWTGGVTDYTINRASLDIGYEKTIPVDDGLTVVLGVGHRQVQSHRDQATWSTGFIDPALDTGFGHAAVTGSVILEQPGYALSGTAALGLFTNDDSPFNLDDGSPDLMIGASISGDTASPFEWRASAYSSFRSGLSQFGATMHVGAGF